MRVVLKHDVVLFIVKGVLNVVAGIVDATSADIATRALELMGSLFHFEPVLSVNALSDLIETGCK